MNAAAFLIALLFSAGAVFAETPLTAPSAIPVNSPPASPAPSASPQTNEPPVAPAQPIPVAPAATPAPAPSPTPKPSPTPTQREILNALSEQQVDQAIQTIRSSFFDNARIDDKEIRRATLEGLLGRLGPGANLTIETPAAQPAHAGDFVSEILDARIGYVRLGAMDKESLAQLDGTLNYFKERKLGSLVIDLRAVPASGDFETAADFARRFCQKGQMLFSIAKPSVRQERTLTSNQDPAFTGILIVLTDKNTSGAAEAMAAALRQSAKAMIVGDQTAGEAVEFSTASLGGGKAIRVAVSQVILPGAAGIFPGGIKPDINISLSARQQEEIFRLSRQQGVGQFVFESERARMNEAALVTNTNPEIDGSGASKNRPALWDTVLQRAVDLVTAISFYGTKR